MINLKTLISKGKTVRLKPIKPSRRAELQYRKELLEIVKIIKEETKNILLPVLKNLEPQYSYTKDGFSADIQNALNRLNIILTTRISDLASGLSAKFVNRTKTDADNQFGRDVKKAFGLDIMGILKQDGLNDAIEASIFANTDLIKSISSQYLDRVSSLVLNSVSTGQRYEQLAEQISSQLNVTQRRAELIARDQTAKVNSAIAEERQGNAGIEEYEWSTSGDERVRPEHRANDGKIFRWDSPPPETGHPAHDINCRCVAIPVLRNK